MTTNPPRVRLTSWRHLATTLGMLGCAVAIGAACFPQQPALGVIVGAACYVVYSQVVRRALTTAHRKGLRAADEERYSDAAEHFTRSAEFFDRHRWIDSWRSVLMLSQSVPSYREMALHNRAYAMIKGGNGREGSEALAAVLEEFPGSVLSKSLIDVVGQSDGDAGTATPAN